MKLRTSKRAPALLNLKHTQLILETSDFQKETCSKKNSTSLVALLLLELNG